MEAVSNPPTKSHTSALLNTFNHAQRLGQPTGSPVELLDRITQYVDSPTAYSLALVCRAVTASATDSLWRRLDLIHADGDIDNFPDASTGLEVMGAMRGNIGKGLKRF